MTAGAFEIEESETLDEFHIKLREREDPVPEDQRELHFQVYARGGTYADRVRMAHGPLAERSGRLWDASGVAVEDFGLGENLMVVQAIADAGGQVTVVEEDGPEWFAAFRAFEDCLRRLREKFGVSG